MSLRVLSRFGCLLVCVAVAACASPTASVMRLTIKDANSTVNLSPGDVLEIALEGNPTTGYTWQVAADAQALLVQQGEPEFKPDSTLLGSGGLVTLRFQAVQQGTADLKLIYHRIFEPDVLPLRTFDITIVVRK